MNLRNLEQIQEHSGQRGFPLGTLFLSALAGGALVVVAMASFERKAPPAQSNQDPLAELIERSERAEAKTPLVVGQDSVTFPKTLSDDSLPTTALAAVKDAQGKLIAQGAGSPPADLSAGVGAGAPGSEGELADALPKAPLPAGDLLNATRVTIEPHDELGQLAKSRTTDSATELAPPGEQGGYEIQVASFQDPTEADGFVEQLRKRGHRAYRQAAYVPERGLWHRVRIGSFEYKYQAQTYLKKLDQEERIQGFLVDPEQVKRQQAIRDAKLQAREDKKRRRAELGEAD